MQILIDADNLTAARLAALVRTIPRGEAEIVVAGNPRAIAAVEWPQQARVVEIEGWQQADLVLVDAYRNSTEPLVLASGDGDFTMLAAGHRGPVLIVSDRPASRLRDVGPIIDPVTDGLDALRHWFDAVLD